MTESKYTDKEIIKALEVMAPLNEVCREVYDLVLRQQEEIARQKEILDKIRGIAELANELLDHLRADIDAGLRDTRNDAIGELAGAIVNDVLPQFYHGHTEYAYKMARAIWEKAKEIRDKGNTDTETRLA